MPRLETILLSAVFGAMASCQPKAVPAGDSDVAADSVRGQVSITGTSFDRSITLRNEKETVRLLAIAADTAAMSRIGGVDILAIGMRTPEGFALARFQVTHVEGRSVVDGILADSAGALILRGHDRTWRLGNPPMRLRSLTGARVWVGGPLAEGPNNYGIIAPARSGPQ